MMNQERQSPKELTIQISKEREDLLTPLRQVLCILENGREALETARENKSGLMELATSESGEKTEHTAKESLFMLMAMSMMVSGLMTRQMAMGNISM